MGFRVPIWRETEIAPLYDACLEALAWAERHNDEILLFKLKEMLNLICPRYGPTEHTPLETEEKV